MNKLLLTITVSLAAFATAHAQYSQYGAVENFYQADPDLDSSQYADPELVRQAEMARVPAK